MREKVIKPFVNHAIGKIPLIECALHLFTTSDMEKLCNSKDFKEIFRNHTDRFVDHGYYGMTFYDYDHGQIGIVLSPEGLNHNVIHHEIHHATLRIGSHIGCTEVHGVSEEFFAQIAGYVGDFVYQFMDTWKHKIGSFNTSITTGSTPVKSTKVTRALVGKDRKGLPAKVLGDNRKTTSPKRPRPK